MRFRRFRNKLLTRLPNGDPDAVCSAALRHTSRAARMEAGTRQRRHASWGRLAALWCGGLTAAACCMCLHVAPRRFFIGWRSGMAEWWPRRM